MNDEKKKKLIEEYIKNRSKWSDKNIYDEFKNTGKPSHLEEIIEKSAPIDEKDYSDYSVSRKYTPEQKQKLNELAQERMMKMSAAEEALKQRGYEKYRKKRQSYFGPSSYGFKNPVTGKILRSLGLIGAGIGAMGASDIASAAADLVPGGVEDLNVSNEQKELDKKYFKKLRKKIEK